ncbi:MAG: tRNA uridine-5-carboxymethylaminomethyl(34) synthesis GTPase MnmE [Verrucomicrobiota bacterium]|nr:tRNA uridine-5-carboxymethylaminomethyl(34) synthesis GTPase MnmE [Verrucomicrobiota bacterium]
MLTTETIVALATPSGESAIGIIRVSGPASLSLCASALGVPSPTPRHATLAKYHNLQGVKLDHVLFTYFADQASYTGEPLLEIACHGNPYLLHRILDDLLERGCRMAEPGEFTKRAFLNGKLDLAQAEAVIDVIHARSDAALAAAQKQLSGTIGRRVGAMVDALLRISAHLEAYIDFPEEDLPPEDTAGPAQELALLCQEMDGLIATAGYSTLLRDGARVVIAGPPNAGKSSLMNALAGEERAIVSEEPGTTRDYLEHTLLIGPYLVRLIDTAGLHDSHHAIERKGMAKTIEQLTTADVQLVVLDGANSPTLPPTFQQYVSPNRILVLENKADLPTSKPLDAILPESKHLRVSATTGIGLSELRAELRRILESEIAVPGPDAVIVSARHARALEDAKAAVQSALSKLRAQLAAELVASDLRLAIEAISEITGRIDNERMLDVLFGQFCIGK